MKAKKSERSVHQAVSTSIDAVVNNKRAIIDSDCKWIEAPGIALAAMADGIDAFIEGWIESPDVNEDALRAAYKAYKEIAGIEWSLFGMQRAILAYLRAAQQEPPNDGR